MEGPLPVSVLRFASWCAGTRAGLKTIAAVIASLGRTQAGMQTANRGDRRHVAGACPSLTGLRRRAHLREADGHHISAGLAGAVASRKESSIATKATRRCSSCSRCPVATPSACLAATIRASSNSSADMRLPSATAEVRREDAACPEPADSRPGTRDGPRSGRFCAAHSITRPAAGRRLCA
jgi:hypothetical protein